MRDVQWIGLGEDLQERPIFNGKIYGFLLIFPYTNPMMLGNSFGKLVVTNLHRAILELRFWSLFQAAGAATAMV